MKKKCLTKENNNYAAELEHKTLNVIREAALFLNTREINVYEYLKDDRLAEELTAFRKSLHNCELTKLDDMIKWLDEEWFSYKLNERMAILYKLHPF